MSGARVSLTKAQRESAAGAELLSVCQTLTADGSLSQEEVLSLRQWLREHKAADLPAIAFLIPVVEQIVADGVVTPEEQRTLFLAIEKVLPQDVRGLSRAARQANELLEKEQRKRDAEAAKQQQRDERDQNRPIDRFDFMVAGAKLGDRPKVIERYVRTGESVVLLREKDNPADRNAVAVFTCSGHHFGYVPREDARDLAEMLDSGCVYAARVKKVIQGTTHEIPVVVAEIFRSDAKVSGALRSGELPASTTGRLPSVMRLAFFGFVVLFVILLVARCAP